MHATVCSLEPDIVSITESWTTNNLLDSELNLSGYDLFCCNRPNTCKGGGVLLYVGSDLQPIQFTPASKFPEQVWYKLWQAAPRQITLLRMLGKILQSTRQLCKTVQSTRHTSFLCDELTV